LALAPLLAAPPAALADGPAVPPVTPPATPQVTQAAAQAAGQPAQVSTIEVGDPYVRAVPPGQPNSAAFMLLRNDSGEARALVAAASPAAQTLELHTHTHEGGMMRMRQVERIELPAHTTVGLEPGGLHVMLIGLTGQLEPGGSVDLTLRFDDGSQAQVQAQVRPVEPMQHH
jgi:copper(I)-binding protein